MNDPLLAPLLAAKDAASRDSALETILGQHVHPVVARILSRYGVRFEDAEDLAANVNLRLFRRLDQLNAEGDAIERLEDYVATLTYHVVYDFLRLRYPERMRLKNRLRYVFTHDRRFAMWDTPNGMTCGLARWRGTAAIAADITSQNATAAMLDRAESAEALRAIFEQTRRAMLFDDVVRIVAELWNVTDAVEIERHDDVADRQRGPAEDLQTRQSVQAMWKEVCDLREPQRIALLMNLREENGANGLALLLLAGVATFDAIAQSLGMPEERLAEIWNELPLEDLKIAEMLQISRQQVINLRKSARERLSRRMAALDRWKP